MKYIPSGLWNLYFRLILEVRKFLTFLHWCRVDTSCKLALAGVSLDYLVGDTTVLVKDKKMIYLLEVLQKVNPAYKDRILYMFDLMLKDAQSGSLQEKLA